MGAFADCRVENPKAAPPILEMVGVAKSFASSGSATAVLSEVSLDVREGEFVAIVGSAGSGKTTLASLMAGFLEPDDGAILVEGAPVTGPGPDRELVSQGDTLVPWRTVRESLLSVMERMFPGKTPAERAAHTERFVEKVNLTAALSKRIEDLPPSMHRRVAVACALAKEPRVLLLDEPLGALDDLTRAILQSEIEDIWARDQRTIVLMTGSVDEAVLLADRVLPLEPGSGSTLGPSFPVDLPRPRNRKARKGAATFERIRDEVNDYLMEPSP